MRAAWARQRATERRYALRAGGVVHRWLTVPELPVLFDVAVSPAEGHEAVVVVTVVGEVDMATAPRLRHALVEAIGDGTGGVVVDLGGVDFLDSTGLGVLLGAVKRTRGAGGDLVLARAVPQVTRVFEVTRLVEILPLHDTVESAVAAVVAS